MQRHSYRVLGLALEMDISEAAMLITLADEPELILAPDEPCPFIDPDYLAAARIVGDWIAADYPAPVFH